MLMEKEDGGVKNKEIDKKNYSVGILWKVNKMRKTQVS